MTSPSLPAQSFQSRLVAAFAGEIVNKVCVIGAFFWLARVLDAGVYGEVEWALAVLFVATLASDAGLTTWAAARIAAAPADAGLLVARVGWLRLMLAVPAYGLIALLAWAYGGRAGSALLIYGLVLFLTPGFLQYLFNGLFQPRWAALGNALRGVTFLAVVWLTVRRGAPPAAVAVAELAGAASLAACGLFVAWRVLRIHVPFREAPRHTGDVLASSWRIGATEITWGVHWYAGLILIGYLATPTDAAWESASLRLVMAIHTGVFLYLYVLLPTLVRSLQTDAAAWQRVVAPSMRLSGWMGGAIAVVVTLAAPTLLTTMFGAPFAASASVLRAMIWVIPIAWLSGHVRYSLIAVNQAQRDLQAALVGAGTTIGLTLLLLPWRSLGAGLALLGGTVANAAAAWTLSSGVLPATPLRGLAAGAACCLACLALGLMLTPVAGEKTSAALAGLIIGVTALVAERDSVRDVAAALASSMKPKVGSNADIRT
jgi:O-antigen/teichoic acid export membrane protein